jgi:DNA-binding MarR family transcriptional regulator
LQLTIEKYPRRSAGDVLLVLTIIILDRSGRNFGMSEIASFIGVPESSASRYVSRQIELGHLKEIIDPKDRRRRTLVPSEAAAKEVEEIIVQLTRAAESVNQSEADLYTALIRPSGNAV